MIPLYSTLAFIATLAQDSYHEHQKWSDYLWAHDSNPICISDHMTSNQAKEEKDTCIWSEDINAKHKFDGKDFDVWRGNIKDIFIVYYLYRKHCNTQWNPLKWNARAVKALCQSLTKRTNVYCNIIAKKIAYQHVCMSDSNDLVYDKKTLLGYIHIMHYRLKWTILWDITI